MTLPPLPPGFVLEKPPAANRRRDPWEILKAEGFVATNGYRTPGDVERIRAQGYKPATNGAHNRGDGVDINHPTLTPAQQRHRLRQLFGDWDGFWLNEEGHHRHIQLPGWRAAPGTPGTPNSGLPPLPPGFELEQRGPISPDNFVEEKAARVATLDQGLANGDMSPEQHSQWTADIRAEKPPVVDERGVTTSIVFKDQMPEGPSWTWTDEQKAKLQAHIAKVKSPEELQAFARALSGGRASIGNAAEVLEHYKKTGKVGFVTDVPLPKVAANPDGAQGAFTRGVGDPFNVLDELGAVADTLGFTEGRENWRDSERPFLDVLHSNIDANRSILDADARDHPVARIGGQLLTSVVLPFGAGARTPSALAKVGALEGGAAGFGAGEGNPLERAPSAFAGMAVGGAGGYGLGKLIEVGAPVVRSAFGRLRGDPSDVAATVARESAFESAPVTNEALQNAGPTPAAKTQPRGGVMAREGEVVAPDAPDPFQPPVGRLWTRSRDDLERMLAEKGASDDDKLVQALGADGAREFKRLDAARNSFDTRRADEASREFDAKFGNLTPEQERLVYGIGETDAQADDIKELLRAHDDVLPGEDADWSAYMAAVAARRVDPEEFAAVVRGEGSIQAQAGFVRMGRAYENLRASGVPTAQIPERMVEALVKRGGWDEADASEVVGSFARGMDALGSRAPAGETADMASGIAPRMLAGPGARQRDYIDVSDMPPLPPGFILDEPTIGRLRPAGERLSAEEVAALARGVNPEDVQPIPSNLVESADELPTSIQAIEPPRLGRTPKKPSDVLSYVKGWTQEASSAKGMPVRIDAEDAIDKGVPAELIYVNPTVADRSKLRLRNPSMFGTRYGAMSADEQQLRSLDQLDMDPVAWGFDEAVDVGRLEPEEVADLLRRGLEGDASAVNRADPAYEPWAGYQERAAQRAEFEGRFPEGAVEQRGETITLDDLDALEPPASAYEERPRLTGKVGNINLDRLESPEDVARLIQQVQTKVGGFDEAKRGVVTNQQTRALADELGLKPEDLLKRRRGQALNAEQLYATRVLVQKSREVVGRLAKRSIGGSDEDLAAFRKAWMRHVALEEQVTAATSEAGRALQQFKMLARAGDARGDAVRAYLQGSGGRETVEEVARKLVDLMEDPAQANRFLRKATKARTRDKIAEAFRASLLWGPRTHVVNAVSNALTILYTLPEQALVAGIGAALRTEDRVLFREIGARAVGLIEGARDGFRLAKQAWKTGEPSDQISKIEAAQYRAISGAKGEFIRTPFKALMAADEFFKSVNRQAAINALAYRKAMRGGGTQEEKLQRYSNFAADPSDQILDYAAQQARYYTFQTPLGKAGRAVQHWVNETPGLPLIIPYVKTPINLLKFAGERSLFAPWMKEFKDAYAAGGNARNEAMARMTLGTGFSAAAVAAAADGLITGGGPTNPQERAALLNSGWQPYSIRLGDSWYSYQRFEPVGLLVGAAADFAEVGKNAAKGEAEDLALGLSLAVAKNITSKTWLSGLSDFMEVLTDPERYGKRWMIRLGATIAVPSVIAHAAGAIDPALREVNTMLDGLKNRVPGLSHDLTARRNVWGEEVKRGSGAGEGMTGAAYNFLSPVYVTKIDRSPLMQEVARLKAPLPMPQRNITVGGKRKKLTPEQYSYYVQLSGRPARSYLDDYIKSDEWRGLSDDERREVLKETLEEFREYARSELRQMFPDLDADRSEVGLPPGFVVVP